MMRMNVNFWKKFGFALQIVGAIIVVVFVISIAMRIVDTSIVVKGVEVPFKDEISFGAIAVGISLIALGMSISSEQKMKALTNLNFDEKMAMMTDYEKTLKDMKVERDKIEDIINNKKEIEKIQNERSKEMDDMIKNKRWQEQCGDIRNKDWLTLEYRRDKKIGEDTEGIIERCKYDLSAISHLRTWATSEKKKDLIECVINVIKSAKSIDTCKNNRKKICELIEISLKIAPNNKELINLKSESLKREQ
jgi:hypothetical protein